MGYTDRAANPIAKPAPMADSAGIQTEPPSAKAACGVAKTAALRAAAVPALVAGADTGARATGTNALKSAPEHSSTAPVSTRDRAMMTIGLRRGTNGWPTSNLNQNDEDPVSGQKSRECNQQVAVLRQITAQKA